MTDTEFTNLCHGASQELRLEDPDALALEGEIVLNDIAIGVRFDEAEDATQLELLVDMGEIDDAHRTEIYEAMLAMNLEMDPSQQGALALDVDSSHALFSARVALDDGLDASRFATLLEEYADFALRFREQVSDAASADSSSDAAQFNFA